MNTGCPSLFDLDNVPMDTPFNVPEEISTIGVSMAQHYYLHPQNISLIKRLRSNFPKAEVIAIFHRGISYDEYTIKIEGARLQKLFEKVKSVSTKKMNLAYDLDSMKIYRDVDFHIGYRVHAHAYSLSQRVPSFLIWEDGRGLGMSSNLGTGGVLAFKREKAEKIPRPEIIDRMYAFTKRKLLSRPNLNVNESAIDSILDMVNEQIESNFDLFKSVPSRLSYLYSQMKLFLKMIDEFLQ
jgi:hypothetical protein